MGRKKNWKEKDPGAKAEAKRYEHPIPSRKYILATMDEFDAPMNSAVLAKALGIKTQRDKGALKHRLKAMVRDGQILRNRKGDYCLVQRIPVETGRVIAHRDGFGFVNVPELDDDIFLSPRQMQSVFHGDRVAVQITGHDRRGRPEGRIVEVLERRSEEFAGRYVKEAGVGFVIPENPRITHQLLIPRGKAKGARPGQMVVAQLVQSPDAEHHAVGEIVEVLGEATKPGLETDMAIRTFGLPHRWPKAVKAQTAKLSTKVLPSAKKDRLDLRKLPLVTIDGIDARDFDDAVYAEPWSRKKSDGYRLIVAIADVAHYVEHDSPLDVEALRRGTSVYFPNRVIPMLPEALSNGLCSLKPKVDRLCLVCDMHIGTGGRVIKSRFAKAVMHSAARMTYHEVNDLLWGQPTAALTRKYGRVKPHLIHLRAVYEILHRARNRRGAVDLDLPQSRFTFDQNGKIDGVVRYPRNDAHRLIEECMITANVEAARFLKKARIPALFRNHPPPDEERVERLAGFLRTVGLSFPTRERVTPKDFKQVAAAIAERPDAATLGTSVLRAMMQAVYEPSCDGHFGLALKEYAHFTSPIRRYPDLLVHRAIAHVLAGRKPKQYIYRPAQMNELGEQCSMTERRAEEASRDVEKWLKCELMLDKIGEEFDGHVTAVTEFGVFIEIGELMVEGLVHITALGNDYYSFDRQRQQLVGRRSGDRWTLAQPVRVRVAGVSIEDRKIDFELVGRVSKQKGGKKRRDGKRKDKQRKRKDGRRRDRRRR